MKSLFQLQLSYVKINLAKLILPYITVFIRANVSFRFAAVPNSEGQTKVH